MTRRNFFKLCAAAVSAMLAPAAKILGVEEPIRTYIHRFDIMIDGIPVGCEITLSLWPEQSSAEPITAKYKIIRKTYGPIRQNIAR